LLEEADWNEDTMMNELNIDNETYFKNFMKKRELKIKYLYSLGIFKR